jgi:N-methylhydantoinase A/oxoprolinase/acetone carboxylase beta subunit
VLSALGLVSAPPQRELVRSWPTPDDHAGLDPARAELAREVAGLEGLEGGAADVETFVDCRYRGQSHELTVGEVADFPAEHARRNGYARDGLPIEVVALRARARGVAPLDPSDLPAWPRARVVGPAVATEPDCTVWVPDGWVAEPDAEGAWVITRRGS